MKDNKKGEVRFIRKGGRVIPIRSDGNKKLSPSMQKKKEMNSALKMDIKTGAAAGLTSALFLKRTKFRAAIGAASLLSGGYTLGKRYKNSEGIGDFVGSEIVGSIGKGIAGVGAAAIGIGALKGLNKLRKLKR